MKTVEVGRRKGTFFIEFDQDEIALRIAESVGRFPRPPDLSAKDIMADFMAHDPRAAKQMLDAAKAVLNYIEQQFQQPGELQ
jgi:hypothetical protein